jgi:hypothetical protein
MAEPATGKISDLGADAASRESAFPQLDAPCGVRGSGPAGAEHSNACTITPLSLQLIPLI